MHLLHGLAVQARGFIEPLFTDSQAALLCGQQVGPLLARLGFPPLRLFPLSCLRCRLGRTWSLRRLSSCQFATRRNPADAGLAEAADGVDLLFRNNPETAGRKRMGQPANIELHIHANAQEPNLYQLGCFSGGTQNRNSGISVNN